MKKIIDFLETIQRLICLICFISFLLCVVLQVLTRYVPYIKVIGTEEIAIYSFVWASLMGTAVLVRNEQHFSFDFFRSRASGTTKLVLEVFIQTLLIIFSIYLSVMGFRLTQKFSAWSLTSLPSVSQAWTWSSLLVCGVTMTVYSVEKLFEKMILFRKEVGR